MSDLEKYRGLVVKFFDDNKHVKTGIIDPETGSKFIDINYEPISVDKSWTYEPIAIENLPQEYGLFLADYELDSYPFSETENFKFGKFMFISDDYEKWYFNGRFHRSSGPAMVYRYSGWSPDYQRWFLDGQEKTEDQWKKAVGEQSSTNLNERVKDLRATDYLDDLSDELYRALNFENTVLDITMVVTNYNNPSVRNTVRGYERWPDDENVIPFAMYINLYHYMKGIIDGYQATGGFPAIFIDFASDDTVAYYAWVEKKVAIKFELRLPQIKAKLQGYKELFPEQNTGQHFYSMVEHFFFDGNTLRRSLTHEISHLFDDLIEFPFTSDFVKNQDNMTSREYFQNPMELEAYFRSIIYPYYRKKQSLFQYIAQQAAIGKNINNLIRDIIEDLTIAYQKLNIWDELDQDTKEKLLKRMFSAVSDLIEREADIIEK